MALAENPRALVLVVIVAAVCSAVVATSVVLLRPIQLENALKERSRNVLAMSGLVAPGEVLDDDAALERFRQLDARVVDLDAGAFDPELDPYTFDQRKAAVLSDSSVSVPPAQDLAGLGRRSRHAVVYLVWDGGRLARVILPIRGAGMWSMLYGFIALEGDFDTIAAASFYEQGETPGLGDVITQRSWLDQWAGRHAYDAGGTPAFAVGPGKIDPASNNARHRVDALTGATVTGDAVTALVRYWLGPHGFGPFLEQLEQSPPSPPATTPGGAS